MKIETCLSPALFHLYQKEIANYNVVIIDILRATTTICVAFYNGALEVLPCSSPEEAKAQEKNNFIAAAERNGETVEGFILGNSPQHFTPEKIAGKKIALTTTNGTRALQAAVGANEIIIGSFLNLERVCEFLFKNNKHVMLFCAGWKDKFNLEDTLYAGAVAEKLTQKGASIADDSSHAALDLWQTAKNNLQSYLQKANHVQRFQTLHIESDLTVCTQLNSTPILPIWKNNTLVSHYLSQSVNP